MHSNRNRLQLTSVICIGSIYVLAICLNSIASAQSDAKRKNIVNSATKQNASDDGFRASGVVVAIKQVAIRNQSDNRLTLIQIKENGAKVKKGDLIARFDSTNLDAELAKLRIEHAVAAGELESSKSALASSISTFESLMKTSEARIKLAKLHHEKVLSKGGELDFETIQTKARIKKAESTIANLSKNLGAAESALQRAEMENAIEMAASESNVEKAKLKLLAEKIRPFKTAELEFAILEIESEIAQIKSKFANQRRSLEAAVKAAIVALEQQNMDLSRVKNNISATKVMAPSNGTFFHFSPRTVEEGRLIQSHQTIGIIPDLSKLAIDVFVSEYYISKVKNQQSVTIQIDAFPDRKIDGTVTKVGTFPDARRSRAIKYYPVRITINNPPKELRIQMTGLVTFGSK